MKRRRPRLSEMRELIAFRPIEFSPVKRRLRRALTIQDLRVAGRRVTPRAVFDYTDGAAEEEISLARSRGAFGRVEFSPLVLRNVAAIDLSTTILGETVAMPLVLAPTGYTRMMHHAGEPAVARAAARAGIPYALSTMGTTSVERLAADAPDCRRWFQLYLWRDRDASVDLVRRAQQNGYDTIVLTVDVPAPGMRLRDVRNGMTIPPSLTLRTVIDGATHPQWWFNFLTTEQLEFASLNTWKGTVAELTSKLFDPTASLADVKWLRDIWKGKLVVKGVQTLDDVNAVIDAGADAVVISNHGGRQLDRSKVPLENLSGIAKAVGDRAEVHVDGGVMSGADIVAALCLGATGVWIGRAYLYGLMAGGEEGVDRALAILRSEAELTMKLLGVTRVSELTADRASLRS